MSETNGHRALRAYLQGREIAGFARAIGVSRQTVHRWISGQARPSPDHWHAIQDVTGIPAGAWLLDAGRAQA